MTKSNKWFLLWMSTGLMAIGLDLSGVMGDLKFSDGLSDSVDDMFWFIHGIFAALWLKEEESHD